MSTPEQSARRRRTGAKRPSPIAPTAANLDVIAADQVAEAERAADAEDARQMARRQAHCFGDV